MQDKPDLRDDLYLEPMKLPLTREENYGNSSVAWTSPENLFRFLKHIQAKRLQAERKGR